MTSNVSLTGTWPLLTVTVIVAVPPWFAAGVTVTVRLEPLPPKTMFALGTRLVFDEEPVRSNESSGMTGSLTVKLIGPVELLLLTVTSAIGEIPGGAMLLIHWASAATASVSIRLRASGGILNESRLLTRRYMIEREGSCGSTSFAPAIPSVLATAPLIMFWFGSGVSKRASQNAGTPPGRWHWAQLASR